MQTDRKTGGGDRGPYQHRGRQHWYRTDQQARRHLDRGCRWNEELRRRQQNDEHVPLRFAHFASPPCTRPDPAAQTQHLLELRQEHQSTTVQGDAQLGRAANWCAVLIASRIPTEYQQGKSAADQSEERSQLARAQSASSHPDQPRVRRSCPA